MYAEVTVPLPVDKSFHYKVPDKFAAADLCGRRVIVPFGPKKVVGYVTGMVAKPDIDGPKEIISVVDGEAVLNGELLELARWMSARYLCSFGEALSAVLSPALRAPKRADEPKKESVKDRQAGTRRNFELTDEQKMARDAVVESIKENKPDAFLLHGITGSGKTEVYLSCAQEAISRGRSVIFLLPEISLTPQFIGLVRERFGDAVGLWHSKVSQGQKYRTWEAARKGAVRIMLGARSAVFAPFVNLGLIIVDEEHEPSYKQDQKPAYNTRDVALKRAELCRAVALFGSATPSLEMFHKSRTGGVRVLELPERVEDRPLPGIEIIDIRQLKKRSKIFSERMLELLERTLARREQAIIFLNRRGFSPGVMCRSCGKVWQCPECSVSLVYHKSPESLKCHYCDHKEKWPGICPACGRGDISIFGVGTQKVEEEIKNFFPQAKVVRLDRDTASKKGVYETVYRDFKEENFDILLGTQMVAKGFDFPRVTLVGVVDADTALYLPDFRSSERTFQLITQVAGRSGRSELGGRVVVQSRHPEHYVLKNSQKHDYRSFFEAEIEFRKEMHYPPFCDLVNVMLRGKNEKLVSETASKLHEEIDRIRKKRELRFEILGPSPSARYRLYGQFRWQMLLKGGGDTLLSFAREFKGYKVPRGVYLSMDVDPQTTL
ncbi:MAG: primosomal protein N' [Endomicrobiales bacterium]|nr:primosomal protein N' [Endomicrobiales bacterium]